MLLLLLGMSAAASAAGRSCEQLRTAQVKGVQVSATTEVIGTLPTEDLVKGRGQDADKVDPHLANLPAFCRVIAILTPVPRSRIEMELWLPAKWNGKLLAIGSHGFGGNFERGDMAMGLHRGYAVVMSDLGHSSREAQRQNNFNVGSGAFAVGNNVAIDDFAWRATHESAVAAKELVKLRYGSGAKHAYFDTCSNGGRQAMREAQQFPDDFDGIIAGSAAMNWTRSFASTVLQYQSGMLPDGSKLTDAKLQLAQKAALAACDRIDGLADGLINDPRECHWQPRTLLCKSGESGGQCLTDAEVAAIERIEASIKDPASGEELFPGLSPGSETHWRNLPAFNAVTANYYRYMVLDDPKWTPDRSTDIVGLIRKSEQAGSPGTRINSMNPDLSAFRKRGGRLIQFHGWNDPSFAAADIPRYYAEVVALQPDADKMRATQDFYRLFMIPGMAHCYGGDGPVNIGALNHSSVRPVDVQHDVLEALDRWVDKRVAPDTITGSQVDAAGRIQRQMPSVTWPKTAVYVKGDANDARSFQCRVPARSQP